MNIQYGEKMKGKEEIYELITHLSPFEKGDIVKFIEDCEFKNPFDISSDNSTIVKKGTLAKIKKVDERFLTLKLKGETTLYLINTKLAKKVLIKWDRNEKESNC